MNEAVMNPKTSAADIDAVRIDGERLWNSLMELAQIGATPKGGVCRLTLTDLDKIKRGLAALVNDFKKKLAAEKAEAERLARMEAARKMREAEEAARKADAADIEAQREAIAMREVAAAAQEAAQAASKDTVKGLRTVTRYEIEDHRAALHWIATNDREAITAFIEEYVRKNHKTAAIDGVRVWQEKEAF